MAVDAGHPDYENAEGIDDLPVTQGTGGVFGDYPGINMDSILGVPFVIMNAVAKESRTDNAKEGDHYVIVACEFVADHPKKFGLPKDDAADPIPVRVGAKFSVLTGSYRIVNKVDAMFERRNKGELAPFEPPFGPVMFAKVAGEKTGKARDLVGYSG